MKAITKIASFVTPTMEKIHPIVLHTCRKLEDYIACLDTDIHFSKVHAAADKTIQTYPIGKLFNRYGNVMIPEEGKTMWTLKEASQATAFHIENTQIVTGTCDIMRRKYPQNLFPSNQKNPDICQDYSKASFSYKGNMGYDYKNIMGKTAMDGRNQILIGSYERFTHVMDMYETTLLLNHNVPDLKIILDKMRVLAMDNDWKGQLILLAENAHKFPVQSLPPLYTQRKLHMETFVPDIQQAIIRSKQLQRWYSKKAYEQNIPENNFSESDVQNVMAQAPY